MSFMFSYSGDFSLQRRPQSTDCARKIHTTIGLFPRPYFDLKSQFSKYKRIDSQNSFKYAFV